jgi:hypothetical protein
MKINIHSLVALTGCLIFSYTLPAQDKPAVLQDSLQNNLNNRNSNYLTDTSLLKKDTLKKSTAAAIASDNTTPTPSHLQLNVVYESNDVYLGRKDSSVLPLVTPEISYIFKSGFEIDLSVGFDVSGPSPTFNSWSFDVSYSFNPGNYSGSATLTAANYSPNSGSINSSKNGSLAYNSSYDFGFIEPNLNLTWTFDSIPDYQVTFALQHEFDFLRSGNLSLTPTATMNASTQNIYNSYYKNKKFNPSIHGKPPIPANASLSGEVLNSGEFQIMDYEFSAPVDFTAGKWSFDFTPTYAIPVNPADIKVTGTINNQTVNKTYKEVLPNVFYFQVGVTYAF